MTRSESRAEVACLNYDHWASEVARLTKEISGEVCPKEAEADAAGIYGNSCFKAQREPDLVWENHPEMGAVDRERWVSLSEVEERVADCPSCSRLCKLIRARRYARKRWGVAKRQIRHAAKNLRSEGASSCMTRSESPLIERVQLAAALAREGQLRREKAEAVPVGERRRKLLHMAAKQREDEALRILREL